MKPSPSLQGVPVELKRKICALLGLSDLKSIRSVCRAFRDAGAEFLLSEVYVLFTIESIGRLRDISLHPIIHRCIKSLVYEGDRLDHYEGKKEWKRFNERKVAERTLQKNWQRYRQLERIQDEVQDRDFDYREIGRAIMRMPKLEKIQIAIGQGLFPFSAYYHQVFGGGNTLSQGDMSLKEYEPPGFRQVMSVVVPAFASEEKYDLKMLKVRGIPLPTGFEIGQNVSKIKTLHMGFFGCLLFMSTNPSVQKAIARELGAVEDIKLQLATSVDNHEQKGAEIEMCEPHLRKTGCLRNLLTAAPLLRKLHIEFDIQYPVHGREGIPTELRYVVGDFTWEQLEDVTFVSFQATSKRLVAFLGRHKQTLKRLRLRNMSVGKGETWLGLVKGIRAVKEWDDVSIEREMSISGQEYVHALDEDYPHQPCTLYRQIKDYLEGRRDGVPPKLCW